jgi:diacylglycerol kinase
VALLTVTFGLILKINRTEWLFLIFAITLVILMEIVNSAVERVSDVLKPRINTYVMEIKDIMAAAVMLASISAVIIGLIIFLPHLRQFSLAIGLDF